MKAASAYSYAKQSPAKFQRLPLPQVLLAIGVCGLLFRFWLAANSSGCDDADIWQEHARIIAKHGLRFAYQHPEAERAQFNHPPLMGYLSLWGLRVTGSDLRSFSWFMKAPGLFAELLSAYLLWKIHSKRGAVAAASVVAGFGLSLTQIEVAGFHCNTDCAYAGLSLLAFYLMREKRSPGLSGLALAAALNVKIMPLLMVPPLLSQCRSWRDARSFVLASSLAIVPYSPHIFTIPKAMYRNMVAYNSLQLEWGLNMFLKYAQEHSVLSAHLDRVTTLFVAQGRWLIVGSIAAASLLSFFSSRRFAYHVGALAWALFLVLTPGYGVQYAVCVVPLLFAAEPRTAVLYGTTAGLMLFFIYTERMKFELPLHAFVQYWPFPRVAVVFGVLAWAILLRYVFVTAHKLVAVMVSSRASPRPEIDFVSGN
jgi:hypothetical protein